MRNKMNIKTLEHYNTWFFFPIYGIHLKQSKNWRNFAFQDSTIVNAIDIRNYLKKHNIQKFYKYEYLKHDFPDNISFIVVNINKIVTNENKEEIIETANLRANQIAAFLFFFFIFVSDYRYAVSLGNEVYKSSGSYFYYYSSKCCGNNDKYTKGEFQIPLPKSSFLYSRSKLLSEIKKKPFAELFKIIIENGTHFKDISSSLVNFYRSVNVQAPFVQQTGSITSIELLLKNSDKYEHIEKRVKVLLGEDIYNIYVKHKKKKDMEEEGVFEKRHNIIHKAASCSKNEAYRAIKLYCWVLLGYCKICHKFYSNEEICLYLDLIYKYKYNDLLKKNDTFKILNEFFRSKLNIKKSDMIFRHLIYYFGICKPENKFINSNDFIKLIYYFQKIAETDLQEVYSQICHGIYYFELPYKSYSDFINDYNYKIKDLLTTYDEEKMNMFKL